MKARGVDCSSATSQPTLTTTQGKGALEAVSGRADTLAARGLPPLPATARPRSQQCPHRQHLLREEMNLSCGSGLLSMAAADRLVYVC